MGRAMAQISGAGFVAAARRFIGVPYVWGGESPAGVDCSGLVAYCLSHMGITNVPRTSEQQWNWVQRIGQSQLQPGDLIFETWPGEQSPGHVAIYAGGGMIIEAPAPGQNVHEVPWTPGGITASGGTVVGYGRVPGMTYDGGVATLTDYTQPAGNAGALPCPVTLVCLPVLIPLALIRRGWGRRRPSRRPARRPAARATMEDTPR